MKVGLGLYVRNSAEAVALYQKAFGVELGYHVKNPDGSFFHSELCRDGVEMFDVVEAPKEGAEPTNNLVQVGVTMETEADVRRAFELLCDGGSVELPIGPLPWSPCAASVKDRFGAWWYLSVPGYHPPDDYDPAATDVM